MDKKEQPFHLTGLEETKIVISESHEKTKADALKAAGSVKVVSDGFSAEIGTDVLRSLKVLMRDLENSRKEVKAPLLELSRKLDATAKDFIDDITREANRISRLIGAWQAAEREKKARELREAQRKEREAREEAQRKAAQARSTIEFDAAIKEGSEKIKEARIEQVNTRSEEPKGSYVQTLKKYEVTDINALYKARPECCRLEPNGDMIRALIKHADKVDGLRIWEEVKTIVRT